MKRNFPHFVLAVMILAAPAVHALDVPRSAYTFDRLAEAQASAWSDKKPVIFFRTDLKAVPRTGQALLGGGGGGVDHSTFGVSMAAFGDCRSVGKLVVIDQSGSDETKLPPAILDGFSPIKGKDQILEKPALLIADPALTKVYGSFMWDNVAEKGCRDLLRDPARAFKELVKANALVEPGKAVAPTPAVPASATTPPVKSDTLPKTFPNATFESWTSGTGSVLEAKLTSVGADETCVFTTRDGSVRRVPLGKLAPDSQQKVRALMAGS